MNNISDPNATEMRGWVMLMLQRAAENVNPSECNDPAVLLACSLGSDSCPAACQKNAEDASEEETAQGSTIDGLAIAGDLTVAVADYSSEIRSIPMAGTVVFNAVDFKSSEKVTIESVKLERLGLSSKSDVAGVWFEKDGVAVSAKASLSSNGTATTRFYNGYSIDGSATLDLVVELKGTTAGSEIAFKVVDVTSTAKNSSFNTQTNTYRTTKYTVATVEFDAIEGSATASETNPDVSYKLGEKNEYEIGRFDISNTVKGEDKDVVIKSLKLKNSGKVDLAASLKNVKVYRNNKVVSKNVELASKDMTIFFDDEVLSNGKKGAYTIMAEIASLENVGDTVKLYLNKDTELVANETSTNFRAVTSHEDTSMKLYKFDGGKFTFTSDSSFAKSVEAAQGSTDVVIAKGTFTVSEPIKLEGFRLTGANTSGVIAELKLEIGGSTYTLDGPTAAGVFTLNDEVYVSKTSDVRLLAKIESKVTGTPTVTFASNLKGALFNKITFENTDETFEGSANVTKYVAGAINVAKLTIKTPTFSITNKASGNARVVKNTSDPVVIFDGEVTTNKDSVSVTKLVIEKVASSADIGTDDSIDLTIYVNGDEFVSTSTYKAGSYVQYNNIGDVEKGKAMKLKIEATPSVSTPTNITFVMNADGTDSQSNPTTATNIRTLKLEIVDNAEVTIANSTATSTVEIASSNSEILRFTAEVENGSATLTGMKISGAFTGLSDKEIVTAELNGATYTTEYQTGSSDIIFTGINENLTEGTVSVKLTANVDSDTALSGVNLTVSGIVLSYDDHEAKKEGLSIVKYFTKAQPKLSLVKNNDNELVVKVSNPSSAAKSFTIIGYTAEGKVATASLNGQTIGTGGTIDSSKEVTLSKGGDTELRLGINASGTVKLTGITVRVEDGSRTYTYEISDTYTNVATWGDLKVNYKS